MHGVCALCGGGSAACDVCVSDDGSHDVSVAASL